MSRRTAQSLFRELGERGKLELFDTLQEIRTLAELDDESFAALRAVLFGSDSDPWPHQPNLDAERAGMLLEVMRDLLYQTFVRKARLHAGHDLPQDTWRPRQRARLDRSDGLTSPRQATNTRALRNRRIQPPSSPHCLGGPGILHGAEDPFRVRHQRGDPAIRAADAGKARAASRWD